MVHNIAIVGFDRERSYEIARELSIQLDMHFFDCIELYEFDNIPRDFTTMLREYGERYYRQKEKGMLKYAAGFDETVINLECGMASHLENFKTLKKNCLVIYLHAPASVVKKKLSRKKYPSKEQKKFFDISIDRIDKRIQKCKANADIIVKAATGSTLRVTSEVLRKIKEYYKI